MKFWFITIILAAGLAACAPQVVPTPQQTPETELAEPVPVTVASVVSTLAATPTPTNVLAPTSTSTPSPPTETPTTGTSPIAETATPLPELVRSENVTKVASINSFFLNWSPVENEFVYNDCPELSEPITFPEKFVFLAAAPTFENTDITPEGFSCFGIVSFIWSPSGQEIFFTGVQDSQAMFPYDEIGNVELWRMNKTGTAVTFTNLKGWYLQLDDWLHEETILYSLYSGGMARNLMIYDLDTDQEITKMWVHNPHIYAAHSDFVVLEYGSPDYFNSVAILSLKPSVTG